MWLLCGDHRTRDLGPAGHPEHGGLCPLQAGAGTEGPGLPRVGEGHCPPGALLTKHLRTEPGKNEGLGMERRPGSPAPSGTPLAHGWGHLHPFSGNT